MKKFVGTLRNHEDLLINYFKANKLYSSGIVESLNLRIKLCVRKSYGYRSFELPQTSLYIRLEPYQSSILPTDFAKDP